MSRSHNAINHHLMHTLNRSLILSSLRKFPSQSRAKLAERTGLTRSTVSKLVDELIDKNFIHEVGLSPSRGGRRGVMLALNPDGGCAIALKIGAPAVHCILTNFIGETLWEKHIALKSTAADTTLRKAESLIDEAMKASGNNPVVGIGVGITGIIGRDGSVKYSAHLDWHDVVFREHWEQQFHVPVNVDNEVSFAALGENHYGSARDDSHFIFIEVGHGVGAGIVIDGRLYQGVNGYAGEIGFMMMGDATPWEDTVNIPAVLERLSSQHLHNFDAVLQGLARGDDVVINTFCHVSQQLGLGIASLVNIFDIPLIIIGGELGKQLAPFLDMIRAEVLRHTIPTRHDFIELRISHLEPDACLMGAVAQVFDDILQEPSWQANI